jgi:hypothetical protein
MVDIPDNPIELTFVRAKYSVFYLTSEPNSGMCYVNENIFENTKRVSTVLV